MNISPIRTEAQYQAAIAEIEIIFNAEPGTEDFDRLEILLVLVHAYEAEHHAIEPPDPIAAIQYEMEKRGLTRRDLEPLIGSSGRVSEILNRKRRLTYKMLQALHSQWGMSGDILLNEYALVKPPKKSHTAILNSTSLVPSS